MTFFNKKEEVIDLILTRKGREKLGGYDFFSSSPLEFTHYEFSDEDVIYDSTYAGPGTPISESQNKILERIKEAPITKNQTDLREVRTWRKISDSYLPWMKIHKPQESMGEFSSLPLSKYKPAWEIGVLDGFITGSSGPFATDPKMSFTPPEWHYTSSIGENKVAGAFVGRTTEKIPQIDLKCTYYVATDIDVYSHEEEFVKKLKLNDNMEKSDLFTLPFEDSYILLRKDSDDFTIKVVENNVPSTKENFTLEVYKYDYDGGFNIRSLIPLYFEDETLDGNSVEHYFNISTDAAALEKSKIEFVDIKQSDLKEAVFITDDECEDTPATVGELGVLPAALGTGIKLGQEPMGVDLFTKTLIEASEASQKEK